MPKLLEEEVCPREAVVVEGHQTEAVVEVHFLQAKEGEGEGEVGFHQVRGEVVAAVVVVVVVVEEELLM